MEEKRKDAGNLPVENSASETPKKTSDASPEEPSSSRRRMGGQKRKANLLSNSSTPHTASSSKRQAREKPLVVPFPQIHNGPWTRARQQPNSASEAAAYLEMKSEVEAEAGASESRALKVVEEDLSAVREDYEALEAKIEAEYEVIKSRDANAHVVPIHCGWFSWTKIHPLEERTLPSFFSRKSENRTPEIYMEIRNWIINKFHANPNTQIEKNDLSELSIGESDAKQEVMEFLDYWGLINYHPFPETASSVLSIDADVVEKTDSLLERLYQFDTEQSCAPVAPRSNVAMLSGPAMPSRLFPDSAIAEELVRPEGPSVEYHCNSCSADCSRKRYHCQKQADFDLCTECFSSGKFDSNMAPSDFILMEPAEAAGASGGKWTDQETLLLLEALELYKENWNEIAEHVATKTKAQCILHFVQMPIEDTFMDCADETDSSLKENADPISTTDDALDPKDANEKTEHKDGTDDNLPLSSPMEISKPEHISEPQMSHETGENCAVKALREAFEAVGSLPSPKGQLSFAEAGNPVMALAAFLVRLVEPNIVTASVRTSLKSVSGNASGMQLAARHCVLLEDPIDEKRKSADSQRVVAEVVGLEGKKDEKEEKSSLVSNICDSSNDQENEKNKSSLIEEKELLVSPNGKCLENTHASKQPDVVTSEDVDPTPLDKSANEDLLKEQKPSNAEESSGLTYTVELPPSSPEESEDAKLEGVLSQSTETPTEVQMLPSQEVPKDVMISDSIPSEKKEPEQLVTSNSIVENGENSDEKEAKDGEIDNKDPVETKNDLHIDKIKHSAVTAISAAAVKAKILANNEEDQIQQLATLLIEKQLHKLETKLAFFSEMDSVVTRVRELLERSKQKLYQERAQIIAARLGVSASSSRHMPQSLPVNRAAMLFANSAPRPPGSMTFQRPPISKPIVASAPPTSNTLVSTTVAGNSVQPSNHTKHSSVGMK